MERIQRGNGFRGQHVGNDYLGLRFAGQDQAHHSFWNGARAAGASDFRREADGHGFARERRAIRAEYCLRLESRRVRDVWNCAARARYAIRVRTRMVGRRAENLAGGCNVRLRWPLYQTEERDRKAETVQGEAGRDECGLQHRGTLLWS